MTTVCYCIPTFNRADKCVEAIHAVMRSSRKPDQLIIIDDSGTQAALPIIMPVLSAYYDDGFTNLAVLLHDRQCGVSASWNQFLVAADTDYVLIANDDVCPHERTIELMVKYAEKSPKDIFFCGDGDSGNAFSFFMVPRQKYIDTIGGFDENFFPAYFEDNDADERIRRAGYKLVFVPKATYDHTASSTLNAYTPAQMQQHHRNFERNREYFKTKWGGLPGATVYTHAFNKVPD